MNRRLVIPFSLHIDRRGRSSYRLSFVAYFVVYLHSRRPSERAQREGRQSTSRPCCALLCLVRERLVTKPVISQEVKSIFKGTRIPFSSLRLIKTLAGISTYSRAYKLVVLHCILVVIGPFQLLLEHLSRVE